MIKYGEVWKSVVAYIWRTKGLEPVEEADKDEEDGEGVEVQETEIRDKRPAYEDDNPIVIYLCTCVVGANLAKQTFFLETTVLLATPLGYHVQGRQRVWMRCAKDSPVSLGTVLHQC